jgi:hypothetical protein
MMHRDARLPATCASAVVLALAVIVVFASSPSRDEGVSYHAGYAAAANPRFVRSAMSGRGMNSMSFCDELLKRQIANAQQTGLRRGDFHRGCQHAVHDVME